MINNILFFFHYGLLLLFGVLLSAAFAGVRVYTKKNLAVLLTLFLVCCGLQLGSLYLLGEEMVWKLYPLITHLPLCIVLYTVYHKRLITTVAAVCSAYLCCQPAKWLGILTGMLTNSFTLAYLARIITLIGVGFIALYWLWESLSQLFSKDSRSVWIFASVPLVYYLFDYSMGIYTDLWVTYDEVALEFLPFFLCFTFLLFCFVYYKQYEQKADAQRSEQIVRIAIEQQSKELEAVRRSDSEVRMLRHDMRMLLSSLAVCIDEGNTEKAKEMIGTYAHRIEGTAYKRFCSNDMVNYVLSDFYARCKAKDITFSYTVDTTGLKADEILFCSILSNALDNALNAQDALPAEKRSVRLLLKSVDGKLLLSVANPIEKAPVFVDGLPVAARKDHGYGTQSIRYLSQRLGGNCRFSAEEGQFITRVIL